MRKTMPPSSSYGNAPPPRDAPKLLSLLNSTLSSSHELVRSIAIVSTPSPSLVRPIRRNLATLAEGIVALQREQATLETEGKRGKVSLAEVRQKEDEVIEVKSAWDRLCEMLDRDERTAELLQGVRESHPILFERIQDNDATLIEARQSSSAQRPYRDEDQENHQQRNDEYDGPDNAALLESQQQQMARQDDQLDVLGQSIGRQHHLSLQMNEELATHAELLDEMDRDVDSTTARLGRASRNLDKFTKSLKEHGSTWTIFVLIVILVLLIAVFK